MRVVDDFFSPAEYSTLRDLVYDEIAHNDRSHKKNSHGGELIDLGLENSQLYMLEGECKKFLLRSFIENGLLKSIALENAHECYLRYHECKYPYRSLWHKDRTIDWEGQEIDYFGLIFYFDIEWKTEYGGLFIYKSSLKDLKGTYIEPLSNRLIINDQDDWHSVTMIVDPNIVRKSINFFVPFKFKQ
jgi:hypothetical protein